MKRSVLNIVQTGVAVGELVVSLVTLLVINSIILVPAVWMVANVLG